MRKPIGILFFSILLFVQFASAQGSLSKGSTDALPPVILAGLEAYKDKGPEEAVKAWIKGSAMEGSKEALSQANNLRMIQDFYGAYQSFELVKTRELGAKARVIYATLNFEKGPLFAKFVVYQANQGWILTFFNFNTKEEAIFPSTL